MLYAQAAVLFFVYLKVYIGKDINAESLTDLFNLALHHYADS